MSVHALLAGTTDLLRRAIGEAIAIETVVGAGVWPIFADRNQLESALLNLAINARDAMPEGGRLTIEASNADVDETYAGKADIAPGQYVCVAVSDTGTGMDRETQSRAFDPFFTTKPPGQGTGLGLSQVYGFVRQSGGHVRIYSEIGEGTTIKIYLPRHLMAHIADEERASAVALPRAKDETVLVVEDDSDVRNATTEMLRELGYRVLEAADGSVALRLLDANRATRLVLTDVGLPGGMNGRQFADEAKRRHPHLKVLFTSGYARNAIVHHGRLDPGVELIAKPFTFAALASRVRHLLDAP
jgi:CheY-like chemotaxis protein